MKTWNFYYFCKDINNLSCLYTYIFLSVSYFNLLGYCVPKFQIFICFSMIYRKNMFHVLIGNTEKNGKMICGSSKKIKTFTPVSINLNYNCLYHSGVHNTVLEYITSVEMYV